MELVGRLELVGSVVRLEFEVHRVLVVRLELEMPWWKIPVARQLELVMKELQ